MRTTRQTTEQSNGKTYFSSNSDSTMRARIVWKPNRGLGWRYPSIPAFVILLSLATLAMAVGRSQEPISPEFDRLIRSARRTDAKGGEQQARQSDTAPMTRVKGGYLRTLAAPFSHDFAPSTVIPGDAQATVRNFLMEHRATFGMKHIAFDLTFGKTKFRAKHSHVRIGQVYTGIPVFAAETVVQLNETDGVEYVSSNIMTDDETPEVDAILSVPAAIAESEAELIAVSMLVESNPGLEFHAEPATLMIYQPQIVGNTGSSRLVWQTTVQSLPDSQVAEMVLVDAHSAEIALHYSLVADALYRRIYDAAYTSTTVLGSLKRKEGDLPYRIVPDVDLAYDYIGDAYNFFLVHYGRDGLDGAGLMPRVYVRWSLKFDAFWSSAGYMAFGEYCLVDDCVAHEYAHGVTQHESGLVYLNESGAINESFSDMWGEWVDQSNGRGDDSNSVKWLIGEDLFPPWSTLDARPALRSMKNPSELPYLNPDRKGGPNWVSLPQGISPAKENDWGGVHTNCGVGNKLCYLLTDGDVFNGYSIYGMGIDRVADLFYEVQMNLLTSAADYEDLYFALMRAAENVDPCWTSVDKQNLEYACQAVQIAAVSTESIRYSSTDVPKNIRDNATTVSTLTIYDAGFAKDVDVKLNVIHSFDRDLEVNLIAPDGTRVRLISSVGDAGDNFNTTTFDDDALIWIREGSAPFNGIYRPDGRLSDFNGKDIQGTWQLQIADQSKLDEGSLTSWSLVIESSNH